ncbi:conserved domain protein [Vibrio maritimus]|uniref:Conserved domain protein n=2 Tax=Vibrio TaxID=662 RepID=A0A090RYL9_9VIBR|nr:conserved domain protein [Vibrio maritimus]GAL30144.1 conserved domain protein [Vibrio variabilis]
MRLAMWAMGIVTAMSVHASEIELPDAASLDTLEQARGGYTIEVDITNLDSDLRGVTSGNVASGTISGNNILSSNAFAESSGISSVIQNTGNNVLIQNSTVVNLTFKE